MCFFSLSISGSLTLPKTAIDPAWYLVSHMKLLGGRFEYFYFFFGFRGGDREEESEAKRRVLLFGNRERGGGL